MDVADVEIPSTSPDASTVASDIATHAFGGQEPAGAYVVGIRLREKVTGAIIAAVDGELQRRPVMGSFSVAP